MAVLPISLETPRKTRIVKLSTSKEFRSNVGPSGGGVSCSFYEVGLKIYHDKGERDDAFRRQTLAHEHGIGPLAVAMIEVDGAPAYLTQVVETVKEYPDYDVIDAAQLIHREVFGFEAGDFHRGNMGYMPNNDGTNRLVFIDFGRHGYVRGEGGTL